jgi:hypothetical protein
VHATEPHDDGSLWSIGSTGSILSIGSAGSILSIGSAGSVLSLGSAGSIASIGSWMSIASIGSALSIGAVGGWLQRPGRAVEVGASLMTVAALAAVMIDAVACPDPRLASTRR